MLHWTEKLFKKHPALFLKHLEALLGDASCEVDLLLKYLKEQKFKLRSILDLNCGIGRHSVELGKRGVKVLGTDLSSLYIKIAEQRASKEGVADRVRFKTVDMRRIASALSGEGPFDGIINLYTSFGYYDDKTNVSVLRQCLKLVRPGGFFALEIMNRDWIVRNFEKRGFQPLERMIVLEEREFDVIDSRMKTVWTYMVQKDDKKFMMKEQFTLDHRLWSPHELIAFFKENGWSFKALYPGFAKQPEDISLLEVKRLFFIGQKKIK
jgi:2-polyprenyl-3-methyl-5-hydroxy-6-metoxy-1,4-benzoquinol methylase